MMYFGVKNDNENPIKAIIKNKSCLMNGLNDIDGLWKDILFKAIKPSFKIRSL